MAFHQNENVSYDIYRQSQGTIFVFISAFQPLAVFLQNRYESTVFSIFPPLNLIQLFLFLRPWKTRLWPQEKTSREKPSYSPTCNTSTLWSFMVCVWTATRSSWCLSIWSMETLISFWGEMPSFQKHASETDSAKAAMKLPINETLDIAEAKCCLSWQQDATCARSTFWWLHLSWVIYRDKSARQVPMQV